MRRAIVLAGLSLLAGSAVCACNAALQLRASGADGDSDAVQRDACDGAELFVNHDYSFEDLYCWQYEGVQEPYYGCFAEAYDLGAGRIICGAFWITQLGYYWAEETDVYVWDEGVGCEPSEVLAVVPGVVFLYASTWPSVGQNDVELGIDVGGAFTIGYWTDFSHSDCSWLCVADCDGLGGHPWTCIAPGQVWPSGWQDPSIVWGPVKSQGIGVYFTPRDPSSVNDFPEHGEEPMSPTWGRIKALFGR